MEKRRLGKTGHMSSILALGGAAFSSVSQSEADIALNLVMEHGINHIDVAPSYGDAEERIGPWMDNHRRDFFVGCKTQARDKISAWESIKRSLTRLRLSYFDLYQFHGVDDLDTLVTILKPEGALEAVLEAKQQGLIKHIGITGHRPYVYVEAINRFDFDTVLFPLSRVHAAHINDDNNFWPLLDAAKRKDVGMIAIKAISKQKWQNSEHTYRTWYEPFDEKGDIDASVWYALEQGVTTLAMPSDISLWPKVIDAAERYKPMTTEEKEAALEEVKQYQPISSPRETLGR